MLIALSLLTLLFLQPSSGEIDINAVVCRDANRSFLIAALAFDLISVIVGVLLKRWWDGRLQWTSALRLGLSLALTVLVSSSLVAWNPIKDEALQACMESAEFSRYVLMSNVAAIPRGLVLGGAASAVLFFLTLIGIRKKS